MLALLVLAIVFFLAHPVTAQVDCSDRSGCGPIRQGLGGSSRVVCFTPATPVPSTLWGELQPADTGRLPAERDTTDFNELTTGYFQRNWFFGVDIQNGYILMGLAHGIGVWDARTDPANPAFVSATRYLPGSPGAFPYIPGGESSKIVFGAISAPDDTVAAVAGYNGAGILVFDLTDKTKPRPVYQNVDKTSESVYTAKIGGTRYAFLASSLPSGLFVYNLDRAVANNGCMEDSSSTGLSCPGVYVGQIPTAGTPYAVHGVGNYIAVGYGSSQGFQIFDVSNPASPQLKLTGLHAADGRPVQGVALWSQGQSYYLGARMGTSLTVRQPETGIFDVSCITSSCSGLGAPLSHGVYDTQSTSDYLTFSRSGSTPYLYVGGDASCANSDSQHEWLLDVSNPSAPRDITPQGTIQGTAIYSGVSLTKSINYWSYYYRTSPTGFNLVAPRAGKFNGDYFYRAGRAIFDIHKHVGNIAPSADFLWSPTEIYPGTPVTFTDRSTGVPTSWSWTFQDGTPANSGLQSPPVTFSTAGTKSVSLTAHNTTGPGSVTKSVVVLSPTPQVGGITVSPANPFVCQPVTFTATGVTGQPTLGYAWSVKDGANNSAPGSPGSTTSLLNWSGTSQVQANGTYTATVTVSNGAGSASKSVPVTFQARPTLGFSGPPTNDPFTAGTVKFHANSTGATAWSWDFGDGQGFRPYTSDPVNGPDPTFTYTEGQRDYTVQVKISACGQELLPTTSLKIHVAQVTPLVAGFQAGLFCQFQQCFATAGQAVTFTDLSTGAQLWDYDWNHADGSSATCNFTDADHTLPVTSHTYATPGDFHPCLRVRRGTSEQNVFVYSDINVASASGGGGGGGGGGSSSLSVSGTSTGQINQAYSYVASSFGCTPSVTGWGWSVSGGTISGASNGATISVTWSTAGTKVVTVSNSGCSGIQGSRNVTITDPNGGGGGTGGGGGGGTLQAVFTFSPSSPKPGDVVTFSGGGSTGSPTTYQWNFGDGFSSSSATATHTYAFAGTYVVSLDVSKPSTGCPFAPCLADSKTTQTVIVGGTPPPPPVSADFSANVTCVNVGGFDQCSAQTNQAVTLAAAVTDGTSYSWDFGDGKTGSSASVTHAWSNPGSYFVTLTVTKGTTATKTRTFVVTGVPTPTVKSVVLPWIAQTRGALVQSSDLYIHNPSANPMNVSLEFRKRGLPESNPPKVSKTIAPGATLYAADVLHEMFNRDNVAGFISLVVDQGDVEPVITSYNTTTQTDGKQFGQTIGGISMSHTGSAVDSDPGTPQVQHLVGLISDADRLAYFGVSNPSENPATYHLRFFDKSGKMIAESSQDFTVSRFGQRQFQSGEIQDTFGISNQDDYRVEIETTTGGGVIPYASNLRLASQDPSFIEAGSSKNAKSYLLGVLSAPGSNNTLWQSDLLLSNIASQAIAANVTFTSIGLTSTPTKPLQVTLPAGGTQRLQNVVAGSLGVPNAIGVLTVTSSSPAGVFPIVQAESYDNSTPTKRFGQSMAAVTDADAAGPGQTQHMVGLRQDATHRTTFWLFNPGTDIAQYDVIYRGLDGSVIGSTRNVQLGGGKVRQFSPNQHPLPAAGVQDGFTVQIVVKAGRVLSAAQVVNNVTNDPSYIQGAVR
jgi:PKD repeat protein